MAFFGIRLFQKQKRRELTNDEREDIEDQLVNTTKKPIEIANEMGVDVDAVYYCQKRMERRKEREDRNQIQAQVAKKNSLIEQMIEEEKAKAKLLDFYMSQRPQDPGETSLADNISAITELINSPVIANLIQSRMGMASQTQQVLSKAPTKSETIALDIQTLKTAPKELLKPDLILQSLRTQPPEAKIRIKQTYETIEDIRTLTAGIGITLKEKEEQKLIEGIRSL